MEIKKNSIYKHFKGDYYIIEDFATHSETKEKYVVYRELYGDGTLWIRPYDMFIEKINKPNVKQEYRFELQNIETVNK